MLTIIKIPCILLIVSFSFAFLYLFASIYLCCWLFRCIWIGIVSDLGGQERIWERPTNPAGCQFLVWSMILRYCRVLSGRDFADSCMDMMGELMVVIWFCFDLKRFVLFSFYRSDGAFVKWLTFWRGFAWASVWGRPSTIWPTLSFGPFPSNAQFK